MSVRLFGPDGAEATCIESMVPEMLDLGFSRTPPAPARAPRVHKGNSVTAMPEPAIKDESQ